MLKNSFIIAKELNICSSIKFVGKYDQKNAPLIYQNSHAYIMLKYKDPCPNTVLETCLVDYQFYIQNLSLPELVNNSCGVSLFVKDSWRDGKIVPSFDLIGKGMIQIFKNYKYLSTNARNRAVKKFDTKYWFERHEKKFNEYISK